MSFLHGTKITKESGYSIDVPTEPITVEEAQAIFDELINLSGLNCGQNL
jgi:hypothetical protein